MHSLHSAALFSDYLPRGGVVRQPSTPRWSEHTLLSQGATVSHGHGPSKGTRSLSVPSLHATDTKAKLSPPLSPQRKPRSRSVRLNTAKKTRSFKLLMKILGSSRSELDAAGGLWDDESQAVGRFRPLNGPRPRSIGGSSDCSSYSFTHSDFSRCNSLRDSSRSRISHGNDSVFGHRGTSLDSEDYSSINHLPPVPGSASGSESNLRPFSIAYMPRSSSSNSLKNYGIQTKPSGDIRHHSIAAPSTNHVEPENRLTVHRGKSLSRHPPMSVHRGQQTSKDADSESLWEDSQSFTYVNAPVLPSDPKYRQIAEELMSCSPTQKMSADLQVDAPRMSEAASVDSRKISNDSSADSLSVKAVRSLPSTPVAPLLRNGGATSPDNDRPATPQSRPCISVCLFRYLFVSVCLSICLSVCLSS